MNVKTVVRRVCYMTAAMLVLFSLWCLLWILSSASMAFTECANAYDLFSSNSRCRQPVIAVLLAIASLLGAVVATLAGRRSNEVGGGTSVEKGMRKWMLWTTTIAMLLMASVFLMWALQTAWLGSFPDRDKAEYSTWAAVQLGAASVFLLIPLVLWVRHWRKVKSSD